VDVTKVFDAWDATIAIVDQWGFEVCQETTTGKDGSFATDCNLQTDGNYYLWVRAEGESAWVGYPLLILVPPQLSSGRVWDRRMLSFTYQGGDAAVLDVPTITETGIAGALHILRCIREGFEYAVQQQEKYAEITGRITARRPNRVTALYPYNMCALQWPWQEPAVVGCHNSLPIGVGLYFAEATDTVVLHEYGHFLFQDYTKLLPTGGNYSWCQPTSQTLAFNEGWANYFAAVVRRQSHLKELVWLEDGTRPWGECAVNRDTSILSVAAVLWDAADPLVDPAPDASNESQDERFDRVQNETRVFGIVTGERAGRSTEPTLADFRSTWESVFGDARDLDPIIDVYTGAAPDVKITATSVSPRALSVGQPITINVVAVNRGGGAAWGGLYVGLPQLSQSAGSTACGSTGGYHEPWADVTATTSTGITARCYPNRSGCFVREGSGLLGHKYDSLLIEAAGYWGPGETQTMTITWTPRAAGTFDVYVRAALCKDIACFASDGVSRDPASGSPLDQFLFSVYGFQVTVNPDEITFTELPHGPSSQIDSGQTVQLNTAAYDSVPDHVLAYAWSASCEAGLGNGMFSPSPNVQRPMWTAPANNTGSTQSCTILVTATDGHGHGVTMGYKQQVLSSRSASGFAKISAVTQTLNGQLEELLSWGSSSGATEYQYCWNTTSSCGSGGSGPWSPAGTAQRAVIVPPDYAGTYWWQVRARASATDPWVYADGETSWWPFTPDVFPPGPFGKSLPANFATNVSVGGVARKWGTSDGAGRYEVCINTTNDGQCDYGWQNTGTRTNLTAGNLQYGRTYYWQVRARTALGTPATYADGGEWWQFTVEPQKFQLSVAVTGSGTITSAPAGINCTATGGTCAFNFVTGTPVTLTPQPDSGWALAAWGDGCTGAGSCSVTTDAPRSVSATFVQQRRLSVTVSGAGSITISPPGIVCTAGTGTCEADFLSGTNVSLAAQEGSGWKFSAWGGACAGGGACSVVMDTSKTVSAGFEQLSYGLSVTTTAGGLVTSVPAGINCRATEGTCTTNFLSGTTVTLTYEADMGWTFTSWGGACGGAAPCSLKMDGPRSVLAGFAVAPTCTSLSISPTSANPTYQAGSQAVTVTGAPAGCTGGSWTASGNGSWLTVSPPSGSGSGSVTVSWTQNGSLSSRSGSATIAGNNFPVTQGGAPSAVYDVTLKVPRCGVGAACDSGTLLNGRDSMSGGPEPNQPNTLFNSCSDGSAGTYHNDESIERIRVFTPDGTPLAAGKTVKIEVTVWAWSIPTVDSLDLYYTARAEAPSWTHLTTLVPQVAGRQVLSTTYVLPAGSGLQAARANFRFGGSVSPCSPGNYNDHDDLAFTVERLQNDFNGDGKEDLVWRNYATGLNTVWYMDGATMVGWAPLETVRDTNWQLAAVGDLDGDGKPDLVWRNTVTGVNTVWYMDGATMTGWAPLDTVANTDWQIVAAEDFDGDGKADLVWRNAVTGVMTLWHMNGAYLVDWRYLDAEPDMNWYVVGADDFNVDGEPDLVWWNVATGEARVWYVNGAAVTGSAALDGMPDITWQIASVGDYDGDGHPDLVWRNYVTGATTLWTMDGVTRTGEATLDLVQDTSWAILHRVRREAPSDFNGDGNSDLVFRNAATGASTVWFMGGIAHASSAVLAWVPVGWHIAAVADFNRDGYADLVWRNTVTGMTTVWYMNGGRWTDWGLLDTVSDTSWEIAAAGDLDGDGMPDLVWRNTVTGTTTVWYMNGATFVGWALLETVADTRWKIVATGDFNGDGKADLLWWHATTGTTVVWYMDGAVRMGLAVLEAEPDTNWQIAMTGDFNRDGNPDIVWRNYATGDNRVWYMTGVTHSGTASLEALADTNWAIIRRR
jgi:hypothetical protein